jgi:hypothetical protein
MWHTHLARDHGCRIKPEVESTSFSLLLGKRSLKVGTLNVRLETASVLP